MLRKNGEAARPREDARTPPQVPYTASADVFRYAAA